MTLLKIKADIYISLEYLDKHYNCDIVHYHLIEFWIVFTDIGNITKNEMAIFLTKLTLQVTTQNFLTFCNFTNRSIVFKCHCLFLLFFFLQRSTTNSIAKKSSLEKQTVKLKCLKKVSQNLKVFLWGCFLHEYLVLSFTT